MSPAEGQTRVMTQRRTPDGAAAPASVEGRDTVSRRRDRERFEAMKRLDPDYKGFRGLQKEPDRTGQTPLEAVTCTVCGRKRNVPRGVALEQGNSFVCLTCSAEGRAAESPEERQ